MSVAVLLGILALFDALLAGFRAAAGRDGRIDKRHYFRIAIGRSAVGAVVLIAINIGVVALLVVTGDAGTWPQLVRAGEICVWVFGAFATLTLAAMAFWFSPIPEYRLLSSIIVLGPLTLFRPVVIAGGLGLACLVVDEPRVWIAAAFAGVTMLAFEHVIGRGHAARWRQLVT